MKLELNEIPDREQLKTIQSHKLCHIVWGFETGKYEIGAASKERIELFLRQAAFELARRFQKREARIKMLRKEKEVNAGY